MKKISFLLLGVSIIYSGTVLCSDAGRASVVSSSSSTSSVSAESDAPTKKAKLKKYVFIKLKLDDPRQAVKMAIKSFPDAQKEKLDESVLVENFNKILADEDENINKIVDQLADQISEEDLELMDKDQKFEEKLQKILFPITGDIQYIIKMRLLPFITELVTKAMQECKIS